MGPFKRKAYSVVPFLYIICGLVQQVDTLLPNSIPRKTIDFTSGDIKTFTKKGVANYSTLLISEEINTLFVGARGAVFALDMDDITEEKYSEDWEVTKERQLECTRRGKTKDVDCQNYILLLQKLNTTTLYVCGSNAFYPSCDYLFLSDNGMHLERRAKESKGRCPFDPTLRFTSLLIDGELYSATFRNFLGTEPIIYRSLKNHLQTELKSSWLNEPSFVHMDVVQESENSEDGDDDKVYIFFSETAIEFEFYDKLLVSRIARVCKGDHGGKRILQKKWTSFLKASLICSAPESNFQFNIVQDVFLLKTANWSQTIFYGVFTQQWGKLDISAVCAFSIQRVREVFSQGKYKELVTVEHSHFKWVMYSGEVLIPRPGACINNSARSSGYSTSLDLPDKTLQFIKDHPLMDDAVYPIGNKPVLFKRGANYTKIVVDRVEDINQEAYDVMFIGTDNGFLHKALNCDGEMFIVEETQLFQSPEPVQSLKLSSKKGLLYAGSPSQVVQIPISRCDRHTNCLECVLARDPYCAWSFTMHKCVTVADHIDDSQALLQSVKRGDASECPKVENSVLNCSVVLGSSIQLECVPLSNLAHTKWMFNGNSLPAKDSKYLLYEHGMVIFNITMADRGFYDCQAMEKVNGKELFVVVASFDVQPQEERVQIVRTLDMRNSSQLDTSVDDVHGKVAKQASLVVGTDLALKVLVAVFSSLFFSLLIWNICKGHIAPSCTLKKIKHPTRTHDSSELKDQAWPSKEIHNNANVISQSGRLYSNKNINNQSPNNSNNLQQSTILAELSLCSSNTFNCTDLQQSENVTAIGL